MEMSFRKVSWDYFDSKIANNLSLLSHDCCIDGSVEVVGIVSDMFFATGLSFHPGISLLTIRIVPWIQLRRDQKEVIGFFARIRRSTLVFGSSF